MSLLKAPGRLALVILFIVLAPAAGYSFSPVPFNGQRTSLTPYFSIYNDPTGLRPADELYRRPGIFSPLQKKSAGDPLGYYWLRTGLHTGSLGNTEQVLSFRHLTYVDIYLYSDSGLILHKLAGAFRARTELDPEDGRFYTILRLQPDKNYTLLLLVHHTKHFQPVFDFSLQSGRSFFADLRTRQSVDAALFGAAGLLLVYTLICLIVTRFRAYAWLMLSIAGLGGYVIGSKGFWIQWFTPQDPAIGWMLNIQFLNAGLLGMYFLVVDFWRLKTQFPRLYFWVRWIPVMIVTTMLANLCIDYFTENYWLTGLIHYIENPVIVAFIITCIYTCWPRLSPAQRYLGYGIVLCGAAGLFIAANVFLNHEEALSSTGLIANCVILAVFLLFSTGLKEEMRHHEVAKLAALHELNQLQQHQNSILEKKVEARTGELGISNKRLLKQKQLLAERNAKIETLINELNHRVKNNLQLLYSLLSLQLPIVKDGISREILKGNIGKIRAMMLVNQKLFNFDQGRGVCLCDFISELATHLQKIYDTREQTRILQDIPADLRLSDRHTLSFGLILSELFTNTFKHAFKDHPDPCIHVRANLIDHHLQFIYSDNGIGIAAQDTEERFTMGIPLIQDLTRQMNGQMSVTSQGGLSYCFTIPFKHEYSSILRYDTHGKDLDN
ncbi:MAG TPA: histidine kinase dimerization/phosphoacceptor domain -containing protein [Puia sp.]|nr:histidine kinase dimerization/phosphoacceptor domain -containing protein [Puia sp.]